MNIPQYITQINKEWFRDVSKRFVSGNCINLNEKADSRSVDLDLDALNMLLKESFVDLSTNQTIGGLKRVLSSIWGYKDVARGSSDYVPGFTARINGDVAVGGIDFQATPVAKFYAFNGTSYSMLQMGYDEDGLAVSWLNHQNPNTDATNSTRIATLGWTNGKFLPKSSVGTSGGAAAYNHAHGKINATGAIVISGVNTANKFVVTDGNSNITCNANLSTENIEALTNAATVVTPQSGNPYVSGITANQNNSSVGVILDGPNRALKFGPSGTQSSVSESSGTLTVTGVTSAVVTASAQGGTVKLSAAANNAVLENEPTVSPSGGTASGSKAIATCGWVEANFDTKVEQPAESETFGENANAASAISNAWDADEGVGLTLWITSRTTWNGSQLREFRRPLTFDKNGRLWSVGGETVHNIDTPVQITWDSST